MADIVENAVRDELAAQAAITDLLASTSALYTGIAPQHADRPFIRVHLFSLAPGHTANTGPSKFGDGRLRIFAEGVEGKPIDTPRDISEEVRKHLDGFRGDMQGVFVYGAFLQNIVVQPDSGNVPGGMEGGFPTVMSVYEIDHEQTTS